MNKFSGFPARMEFTPVPNIVFSALLSEISDMAELKTTLHVLAALYQKREYPRFVTLSELKGNAALLSSLREADKSPDEVLPGALAMATERGVLIHVTLDSAGAVQDIYLLNTEANRQVAGRIKNGELKLGGMKAVAPAAVDAEPQPDIYTLYEQNIGMLTPMIADELRQAEKLYPEGWIGDAIKEAVALNKRNWRYIGRILERWSAEGKRDGAYQRDSKEDPNKYVKGKYGHMVQR